MFDRRCARCGSTSFRADRSLGGRLVCSRCGVPADQQARRSNGGRAIRSTRMNPGGFWIWVLVALIVVVLVVLFQSS